MNLDHKNYVGYVKQFIESDLPSELDEILKQDNCILGGPAEAPLRNLAAIGLQPDPEKVCLDFGCGIGRDIIAWHKQFKQIDGADISSKMLRLFQQNLENRYVYNCSGYLFTWNLKEIPNDRYDVVYSKFVFHHIALHSLRLYYLKDLYSKLKDGGELIIFGGYGKVKEAWQSLGVSYESDTTPSWARTNYSYVEFLEEPIKTDLNEAGYNNVNIKIFDAGIDSAFEQRCLIKAKK